MAIFGTCIFGAALGSPTTSQKPPPASLPLGASRALCGGLGKVANKDLRWGSEEEIDPLLHHQETSMKTPHSFSTSPHDISENFSGYEHQYRRHYGREREWEVRHEGNWLNDEEGEEFMRNYMNLPTCPMRRPNLRPRGAANNPILFSTPPPPKSSQ